MLTHKRLLELLDLNHETGVFTRRITIGQRSKAGTIAKASDYNGLRTRGYKSICVNGKSYNYAHVVWFYVHGEWPPKGIEIDHINNDRGDNRPANLRLVTHTQNLWARKGHRGRWKNRETNQSGYRGVFARPNGTFTAFLSIKGKQRSLGTFRTAEEAYKVWCEAAKRLRGEFARFD